MITPLAVQQPWQPDTTSQDQAPTYMSGRGKQSQVTSTPTARAPCVKKNDQASSETCTLDNCFSLVGPHQQGAELRLEPAEHCSFINTINKWTAPHLWAKFTNDHPTGFATTMATRHHKQGSSPCLYVRVRQATASHHQHTDCKSPLCQKMTRL